MTKMGGRDWVAWFTNDIPIQDGPYKFCGLPGLIIKIEDDTKTHKFILVANKNLNNNNNNEDKITKNESETQIFFSKMNIFKEFEVSHKKLKEIWKDVSENPAREFTEVLNNMGLGNIGNDVIDASKQREINTQAIEKNKRINNFLEKDFLH